MVPVRPLAPRLEKRVFGLTLTKILFTILIIVAVWRAFALVSRLQAQWEARREVPPPRGRQPSRDRPSAPQQRVVDLVQCPRCGAYVARGETCRCERA